MAASDEHNRHKYTVWEILPSVQRILRGERSEVIAVIFYGLGIGLFGLAVPLSVQALVNIVSFGSLMQPVVVLTMFVFIGLLISSLMELLQLRVVELIQRRIYVRVSVDLARRIPLILSESYRTKFTPQLVNRYLEVFTVQKSIFQILLEGVTIIFQTVAGMILLMFYHPLLLGFSIIILISLLFVYLILSRGAVRTAIAESDAKYQVVAWLEDIASHPLLFKSGDGMQYALKRSDQVSANWLDTRESHFRILLREKAAALVIQTLASAGILGVGGYLVIIEQLSLGQLVASEIIVTLVLGGITKFTKQVEYFYELIAGVAKLDSLSNFPLEDAGGDKLPMEGKPIELVFQRFVQQFEGNKILEIDQFKIESGSKVAIYGANGSGKSALADTLFKLHPTSSGTINFDGTNIADLSIESVRNCVALIRDAEIFHGSVDDNIRLGNESFSKKEVRAALEAVGLTEEIESLPDGLDTMLHPWGVPLSRGQTHRLILARALLRSPRLLIIDGLLDSIDDAELERTFRTLQSKDAPWTLIVFTHEFHVMEHFDKRYLLEDKQLQICPRK